MLKSIRLQRLIKRGFDLVFASVLLTVLAIPLAVNAVICRIVNGSPVFYTSVRLGQHRAPFRIYKFRSMIHPDSLSKRDLQGNHMRDGYLDIPLESDVYTRWGRFMENTQIVELPQLLHVLTGKMSLIGNRPLPKANMDVMKESFGQNCLKRFDAPMGITGASQVVGKFNLTAKERLDLEKLYSEVYLTGHVLAADAMIALLTVKLVVFRGEFTMSYTRMRDMLTKWKGSGELQGVPSLERQ